MSNIDLTLGGLKFPLAKDHNPTIGRTSNRAGLTTDELCHNIELCWEASRPYIVNSDNLALGIIEHDARILLEDNYTLTLGAAIYSGLKLEVIAPHGGTIKGAGISPSIQMANNTDVMFISMGTSAPRLVNPNNNEYTGINTWRITSIKKALDDHIATTSEGIHGSTVAATGNSLVIRDGRGEACIKTLEGHPSPGAGSSDEHIANKGYVDQGIASHHNIGIGNDTALAHGATNEATSYKIVARDSSGGAKVKTPAGNAPEETIVNIEWVKAAIAPKANRDNDTLSGLKLDKIDENNGNSAASIKIVDDKLITKLDKDGGTIGGSLTVTEGITIGEGSNKSPAATEDYVVEKIKTLGLCTAEYKNGVLHITVVDDTTLKTK